MTSASLIYSANKRAVGRFPELVLRNAVVEVSPSNAEQPRSILGRPVTKPLTTVGSGPLRGIFQQPGLFSGDAIIVSGTEVYRVTSGGIKTLLTGSVAGSDRVRMSGGRNADLADVVYISTGDSLYKLTTATVAEEDFPTVAQPGCQDAEFHRGFVLGVQYNTQQCYFQIPGDTAWTALSFASAEYKPDKLVAIRTLGDLIFLFGEATTEVWTLTGQADPAISPYGGLNWNYGCRSRDAVASTDSAIIWVDDKCLVRMSQGGEPQVISDSGLAEQLRNVAAADLRAWSFSQDGHVYYVLTMSGDATWVYDLSAQTWATWDSEGYDYFRAHLGVDAGDTVFALDNLSTALWTMDPDDTEDATGECTWEFPAMLPIADGSKAIANVELSCSVGHGPRAGQGSDPLVGMKYSVDGGQTYSGWRYRTLNLTGVYNRMPRWGPLVPVRAPYGHFYRFRIADPTIRRVNGVRVNVR